MKVKRSLTVDTTGALLFLLASVTHDTGSTCVLPLASGK